MISGTETNGVKQITSNSLIIIPSTRIDSPKRHFIFSSVEFLKHGS